MKMRILLLAIYGLPAIASAAQPTKVLSVPLKVQSSLRFSIPVNATSASEQMRAVETARNQLYDVAARECAALEQTFDAACRLTGLAIDSSMLERGGSNGQMANISVQNSYELRPK